MQQTIKEIHPTTHTNNISW